MDYNINWNNLNICLNNLKLTINNSNVKDDSTRGEIMKLIYIIETEFFKIKNRHKIPFINPSIISDNVVDSISKVSIDILRNSCLKANDYQFWLLGFLLLKNKKIRDNHLSLYQIIDEFIVKIQNKSFTWEDVEYTGSGATRCKTNIRFAYNDLKDLGMVYLYDKSHKNSWSLTFMGFFLAVSFCIDKLEGDVDILSDKIYRFKLSSFYHKINKYLLDRIYRLSQSNYFFQIVSRIKKDSLNLPELEKGPEIFAYYSNYMNTEYANQNNETQRNKSLSEFLKTINLKYPLDKYMEELTLRFNAEEFFNNILKFDINNS